MSEYVMEQAIHLSTNRGAYSYVLAKPVASSVDTRPVVLMAVEDKNRMSLCNAMEDVASIIMKREKWSDESFAVWIETAENDSHLGQIVTCPSTMPSWGIEQRVVTHLQQLQKPASLAQVSGLDFN